MPTTSAVRRSPRAVSSAKSARRCRSPMVFRWASSAFHDWRAVNGTIPFIGRPFIYSIRLGEVAGSSDGPRYLTLDGRSFPQAKTPEKRVGVVTGSAAGRQGVELVELPAPGQDVPGSEPGVGPTTNALPVAPHACTPV